MVTGPATATRRKDPAASARDAVPSANGTAEGTAEGTKARKPKAKAPPATLILFVRHGTTPTTGQILPGRAPGLHLADKGRAEAEAVAERLAALTAPAATTAAAATAGATGTTRQTRAAAAAAATAPSAGVAPESAAVANGAGKGHSRRSITAVYASPLERARETAAPIGKRLGLKVTVVRGLIEMDFGEWTGAELKALRKLPEWEAIQRYPSGFQFPGGEGFSAMRARMAATVASLCQRHPGEMVVAVSHADTIKAAVSDALGTHLDLFQRIVVSPCSVTAISYSFGGPVVLAVNATGGIGDLRPA